MSNSKHNTDKGVAFSIVHLQAWKVLLLPPRRIPGPRNALHARVVITGLLQGPLRGGQARRSHSHDAVRLRRAAGAARHADTILEVVQLRATCAPAVAICFPNEHNRLLPRVLSETKICYARDRK